MRHLTKILLIHPLAFLVNLTAENTFSPKARFFSSSLHSAAESADPGKKKDQCI
jgi:hypothetical protein